jgi:PUA-domain protein
MKHQRLGGKEIKVLNEQLYTHYNLADFLKKIDNVELLDDKLLAVNGEIFFFYSGDQLVPSLKLILKDNFLKRAVIDMPAVRFIAGGADVMRPGIVEMDDFQKDTIVSIVDQNNRKPLAIGLALFSAEELLAMVKGKAIKTLHHVGDELWTLSPK